MYTNSSEVAKLILRDQILFTEKANLPWGGGAKSWVCEWNGCRPPDYRRAIVGSFFCHRRKECSGKRYRNLRL